MHIEHNGIKMANWILLFHAKSYLQKKKKKTMSNNVETLARIRIYFNIYYIFYHQKI